MRYLANVHLILRTVLQDKYDYCLHFIVEKVSLSNFFNNFSRFLCALKCLVRVCVCVCLRAHTDRHTRACYRRLEKVDCRKNRIVTGEKAGRRSL